MSELSLRERVARAVCATHGPAVCEIGYTVTDAALGGFRAWLLDQARAADTPTGDAAVLRAVAERCAPSAGDATTQPSRGVA